ncbi:MAG: hypothetical protein EOM66_02125, partial [Clostridia bacterium]|nr:hypothetical protein [Clostridia bacterium]
SVRDHVGERARFATQVQSGALADGVLRALSMVENTNGYVLVVNSNLPLLSTRTIGMLVDAAEGKAASRLVYCEEDEETRICAGYCFEINRLREFLEQNHSLSVNAEHCIRAMRMEGERVVDVYAPAMECLAIRDRSDLWEGTCLRQESINVHHMQNGVTFIDPRRAYIDPDATIGEDTIIYPGVFLQGHTRIGRGCTILDGCRLRDTIVGDRCELSSVVAQEAAIEDGTTIGPFVRLRPNAHVGKGCKIGNFVEIKNSTLGDGGKVAHLTYVGDADIGRRINIGCGTAFANYDGARKHRTTIGDDVFLGCNTSLVAPVKLGNGAYTAAGSTITKDVPDGSLGVGRARQTNIEGWTSPQEKKEKK